MSDKGDSRSRSRSLSRSRSGSRQGRYNSSTVEGKRKSEERKTSHSRGTFDRSRSRSASRHRSSRRRSRTRSRSRTPRRRRSRYSRSRSPYYGGGGYGGSYYDDRKYSGRNRSRSPMSRRRRHMGNREDPKESRCLGVFGLSMYTQEREIRDIFSRYGPVEDVQVVYDHATGRSRGFAFVYMRNTEDAVEAKDCIAGMEVDGHKVRVDFSITERAHTPTPGIYLGRSTGRAYRSGGGGGGGGYGGGGGRDHYSRRSPSPYYGRRRGYSRSRSRSYSPRRY